jgi:two-component system, LuxR family, secretion system response regulator SsrB
MNVFTITPREQEIIVLMSQGLSSKQIAYHLHISLYTVLAHRRNILKKMNKNNSISAINLAMTSGIIPMQEMRSLQVA